MSAVFQMKLRPFIIPNFVSGEMPVGLLQDGPKPLPSFPFPLHELPAEALDVLCAEFRAGVFAKAGKKDPAAQEGERCDS